jgi:hypothetical protein
VASFFAPACGRALQAIQHPAERQHDPAAPRNQCNASSFGCAGRILNFSGTTTYLMDDEEMIRKHVAASPDFYPEVIERWIPDDAALPQVDASDWFYAALGWRDIADEYGITADSTDDDLEAAAELAEKEARDDGFILHFAYKEFEKIREYLRDEREEQEDDE